MKKVLITGATGFVGSNVLKYLLNNTDWQITALCSWKHKGSPINIRPHIRLEIISWDLTQPISEIGEFDFILNLASESHVDRSIAEPVNFIENNISSTLQMLEYARKHPPKLFIQFSTDEVYGATNHKEWDVLLPSNPYAASKAAQEMIAIAYWRTYKVPLIITNSNNIIGEGQNKEKFLPKIIELIKEGKKVEIHAINGKPGQRHYNPVENIASALLFICKESNWLTYLGKEKRPWRFSIGGGKLIDNLEMAKLVAKKLNKPLKFKIVDAEGIRPGYDEFYGELESSLKYFGWKPPVSLEESLEWIK